MIIGYIGGFLVYIRVVVVYERRDNGWRMKRSVKNQLTTCNAYDYIIKLTV